MIREDLGMITPMDLRTKTFKKTAVGGYDRTEVDEYMAVIIEDYEKIYTQSIETTDRINTLSKLLDSYKAMEDTMKNSLIVAQSAAEELSRTAQEKAEIAIDEAKLEAKKIIDEANAEVAKVQIQLAEIKTSMELFRSRAVGMLNAQLEVINKFEVK